MILPPRRSVTRFFIPLIDVLILLFAIFLLMPFVSGPASSEPSDAKVTPPPEPLPDNVKELQRQLTEARDRIKRMEQASQARLNDRLVVRALLVGKDDPRPDLPEKDRQAYLYYYGPNRREIRTEQEARKFIEEQVTASNPSGAKDLLFLILYPRDRSGTPLGYPSKAEEERFRDWFPKGVPLRFE